MRYNTIIFFTQTIQNYFFLLTAKLAKNNKISPGGLLRCAMSGFLPPWLQNQHHLNTKHEIPIIPTSRELWNFKQSTHGNIDSLCGLTWYKCGFKASDTWKLLIFEVSVIKGKVHKKTKHISDCQYLELSGSREATLEFYSPRDVIRKRAPLHCN